MSLGLPKSEAGQSGDVSRPTDAQPPRIASTRVIFAVVATAIFMTNLDLWIVNVALNAIGTDRKSTRLNSSHGYISYAVFFLKKKKRRHGALFGSDTSVSRPLQSRDRQIV